MNPKIQEELPISIYELQKEMKKIRKRDGELAIRAGKTEEYINQFTFLKQKEVDELEKALMKLNVPRLKDYHLKKILDTLPRSTEELKIIFQGYTLTINKENIQKIVAAVNKITPDT